MKKIITTGLLLLAISGAAQQTRSPLSCNDKGVPCVNMNSYGAYSGYITNVSSGVWALGYGDKTGAIGTSAITWTNAGVVSVPGTLSAFLTSKTLAELAALVPTKVGQVFYCSNCTTDAIAVSTQIVTASWARCSSKTTPVQ